MFENNLSTTDHAHPQSIAFTYFCHKPCVYNWADHTLCAYHDSEQILKYCIVSVVADNDSDQLPLSTTFVVNGTSDTLNPDKGNNRVLHMPALSQWDQDTEGKFS